MRISGRWAIPLLAVGLGGCVRDASGAGGLGAVADTVGGSPRLTYPDGGGRSLAWAADTLQRIGDVLGDDDAYQFDRATAQGLAGDAAGDVFVLDGAGRRVLSFDAQGKHRATYGRQGEGPGELTQPFALALGAGDTVWVLDPMNGRLTGFPQDEGDPRVVTILNSGGFPTNNFAVRGGSFLMQTTAPLRFGGRGGRGSFQIAAPAGRGRAAAPPGASKDSTPARHADSAATPETGNERSAAPAAGAADDAGTVPVFRVSMDGTPGDTMWRSRPPPMNLVQMNGGGRGPTLVMAMPPQFQPSLRWSAFSDGGIAVAESDLYEIHLIDPAGRVRLVLRRDAPSWPVGDEEKEFARDRVRKSNLQVNGANVDMGPLIEQQLASMTFAGTVPRITKIRVDARDRLWVGIATDKPGETGRIDVYSRDGEFIGSIAGMDVPDAFFADGRAASIVKDADTDVQQIAILKLNETGG